MSDESKVTTPLTISAMQATGATGLLAIAVWYLGGIVQANMVSEESESQSLHLELKEEVKYSRDVVQDLLKQSIDAQREASDAQMRVAEAIGACTSATKEHSVLVRELIQEIKKP
jgi:hypothetical protein